MALSWASDLPLKASPRAGPETLSAPQPELEAAFGHTRYMPIMRSQTFSTLLALAVSLGTGGGQATALAADDNVPEIPLTGDEVSWCAASAGAIRPYVRRWMLEERERSRIEDVLQRIYTEGIHLMAAREAGQVPVPTKAVSRARARVVYHARKYQWEYAAPAEGYLNLDTRAARGAAREFNGLEFQKCVQLKDLEISKAFSNPLPR